MVYKENRESGKQNIRIQMAEGHIENKANYKIGKIAVSYCLTSKYDAF